ncbi:hypothetical protein [Maridesulfovibrio sp.]|uniref:hypothetical protein n=1 Tax=Maridesulfovibrio sp. TaxID=2795000 RepID=UPI0029F59FEB|nr:hypothetical protein [Maridesulfovibrio sp.]
MQNGTTINSAKLIIVSAVYIICFSFTLPGCTQYYFNPAFPENLQQQMLNRDMAYCNALASGAIPQQQLVVNSVPSSTTYGNFNAYDANNHYSGTYSSYTTYDNSAAQMADTANSMTVLADNLRRDNIYNQCLAGKGWIKTKGKKLTFEERKKFDLPPEGQIQYYYNVQYPEDQQQINFDRDSSQCCIPQPDQTYQQCLSNKGWHKIKGQHLNSEERTFFGLQTINLNK